MSDDFMKSALDRAMERADQIEIPEEKLKEMKYRSQGELIAAKFFKEPDYDIEIALNDFDVDSKQYVLKTVESVLLQNIILPKKETDISNNQKAFQGLSSIKKDKNAIQQAREQLENLSNYYTQAIKQHYEQLKAQVEQMIAQTAQQQPGMDASRGLNAEQIPEFQENWRQISAQLDAEYDKALDQLKQQIASTR